MGCKKLHYGLKTVYFGGYFGQKTVYYGHDTSGDVECTSGMILRGMLSVLRACTSGDVKCTSGMHFGGC